MNVNGINANTMVNKSTFDAVEQATSNNSVSDDIRKANEGLKETAKGAVVEKETIGKNINTFA